jgi:hypothetical protein
MRSIQELYTVLDPSGNTVRPGYKLVSGADMNNPEYIAYQDSGSEIRSFLTDIGTQVPQINTWFFNPRVQGIYVYLTEAEQKKFAEMNLSYIVHQVTTHSYPAVYTRDFLDINTTNLVTRFLIVPRRTDSISFRNDYMNWTNWMKSSKAPYSPTPNIPVLSNFFYSSGRVIPASQRDIIRGLRVICNGNELQEEKTTDYYNLIVPWKYMDGAGEGSANSGLAVYPFSLGSPTIQPSGSINASRINSLQLDVNIWPLPADTTYVYDITVYAETMNWFSVASGYGGVKYAL